MNIFQAIVLGVIQGVTEFLPISSSGHLVIGETLFNLEVSELKDFDVAVHVATLLAILIYFGRDLVKPKYWPGLIIATLPAVVVGLTLESFIDGIFRDALLVGVAMLIMGLLFQIPEHVGPKIKNKKPGMAKPCMVKPGIAKPGMAKPGFQKAFLIGCAQAFALIPGVSRSGSTILAGVLLGMNREEAARFSFMLGAIAIAGAGALTFSDMDVSGIEVSTTLAGFAAAFFSGLLAIYWLMRFLKKHSLKIFGFYLILLGFVTITVKLLI